MPTDWTIWRSIVQSLNTHALRLIVVPVAATIHYGDGLDLEVNSVTAYLAVRNARTRDL